MKKIMKNVAMLIIGVMVAMSLNTVVNAVAPEMPSDSVINSNYAAKIEELEDLSKKTFSPCLLLYYYSEVEIAEREDEITERLKTDFTETDLTKEGIIKLNHVINDVEGKIQVIDAQSILMAAYNVQSDEDANMLFAAIMNDIATKLNISTENVKVKSTVTISKGLAEYYANKKNITLDNYAAFDNGSDTFVIDDTTTREYVDGAYDKVRQLEANVGIAEPAGSYFVLVSMQAVATTEDSIITYDLELGNDLNWYLVPQSILPIQETETEPEAEFSTVMDYVAVDENEKEVEAKEIENEGDPFLAPYYEDEDKDAHKDTDVIVTIKSETEEEIAETNGVALRNDGKANSEGWYYPDTEDKTVIAKKYLFDDYDNTTDNGKVKETVKLTGVEGGEDTQKPSIKWTFRRINVTETKNTDESITVVITYNLPVDEDSIPEGWTPIYDKDGKTIHKITKTIKKGEDYDKNVKVKQNGSDATVTTHVKYKWPKEEAPNLGPQAGGTILVAVAVVASIGVCAFAFRKFRK